MIRFFTILLLYSSFSLYSFDGKVRVLLAEYKNCSGNIFQLTSPSGFLITDLDRSVKMEIASSIITIKIDANNIYINNKKLSRSGVILSPLEGHITFEDNTYDGSFIIIKDQKDCYLINSLHIEDYVYSVLRWESWPGWPIEVNKAFAITCRTYVVAKVIEARSAHKKSRVKRWYDIKNTNIHQTYKGTHTCHHVRQAVTETCGIIMTYKKKPIVAMYDACCGGVIPAGLHGIDFVGAPYLARSYPCTYCKNSKLYSWRVEYTAKVFGERIEPQKKITIKDVVINAKDKAGIVQNIVITTAPAVSINLSGKKIYSLFGEIKSLCFSISKKSHKIVISGKGYGHHLGMCQWGARTMVAEGWDYKGILRFYYPGISWMKLEV